ncbi:glycosyltransferase family 2 protein [Antarcticirhabdus aurantiaca]|uniref:Glycosyltransferase family 2 protein n=1 Tax=Antarcticirhabdus aurantiaca TaxID=2606717 RepID=A0ACD4NW71_9HYPH|nr:glycosyltransferase family 2 protein [Antarcticirhabdus aurantiaca]WAJ31102.1 glycosyltransferase family 2 protein [Jeongeuplla avenae]
MTILLAIVAAANVALFLLVLLLFAEVLGAVMKRTSKRPLAGRSITPSFVLLVPAHDEVSGIEAMLATVLPQLGQTGRVLVVADNCSDATAVLARRAGAEVIERVDPARRGKGHALDFGVRHLAANPPDIVIIVDADCRVAPGAIERLAQEAHLLGVPVQGCYLMRAPAGAGLGLRVAELAFLVKNRVRPAGLAAFGLPCQLTGAGMALPWRLVSQAHLDHAGLVEDMRLGLELAVDGAAPRFCETASIESDFPTSAVGAATQRQRWEEGHLGMIVFALGLLPRALARRRFRAIAQIFDVLIPPLTLLVVTVSAMTAATIVAAAVLHWPVWLSGLAAATLVLLVAALVLAWWRFGRTALPPRLALHVVPYALRKVGLYLRVALGARSRAWIRTDRGG